MGQMSLSAASHRQLITQDSPNQSSVHTDNDNTTGVHDYALEFQILELDMWYYYTTKPLYIREVDRKMKCQRYILAPYLNGVIVADGRPQGQISPEEIS